MLMGRKRRIHSSRRLTCRTSCLFAVLLLILLVGLLLLLVMPAVATAADNQAVSVWLLIDNSDSLYGQNGVGTDSEGLRFQAAELFISYLGSGELETEVGVIFFGSTAMVAAKMMPLHDDAALNHLINSLDDAEPLGWTDHLAAIQLAESMMPTGSGRKAIILLTDGKPELDRPDYNPQFYRQALQENGRRLAKADISLHTIMLANDVTAQDADVVETWLPLWEEISLMTNLGRFYLVSQPEQFLAIYHDIFLSLTQRQTAGVVLETAVVADYLHPISVTGEVTELYVVIQKENSDQQVDIQPPTGDLLQEDSSAQIFRQTALGGLAEIWRIKHPTSGTWTLAIEGDGQITVWQDYVAAAEQTSQPLASPSPTAVILPTLLPSNAILENPLPPVESPPPKPLQTVAAQVTAVSTPESSNSTRSTWKVLVVILLALVGGAGAIYYKRGPRPMVTGLLHVEGSGNRQLIDFAQSPKPQLTVGKPPADVPLTNAIAVVTIRPGGSQAHTYEMLLEPQGPFKINGIQVEQEVSLADSVLLDFGGGVQGRYENLLLRTASREEKQMSFLEANYE